MNLKEDDGTLEDGEEIAMVGTYRNPQTILVMGDRGTVLLMTNVDDPKRIDSITIMRHQHELAQG